jgi:hypothetical protein
MYAVGFDPTRVYTPAEILQGKAPGKGSVVADNAGKIYRCVEITTGPFFKGQLLQITGDNYVIAGPTAPAGVATSGPLAVYVATATGSTSSHVFVQVYGPSQVLASATQTYTPGLPLRGGTTAGNVDPTPTTASAYISGMTVISTTTVSVVVSLINVFLNHPRLISG